MKPQKSKPEFTRENYAATSEDAPYFPFRPASMAHIEMDGWERAMFEFVQQAGQPSGDETEEG